MQSPYQTSTPLLSGNRHEIDVHPSPTSTRSGKSMLKISSLLNPSTTTKVHPDWAQTDSTNSTTTPPLAIQTPSSMSRFGKTTASPSLSNYDKPLKEYTIDKHDGFENTVNYPPFECAETAVCLMAGERQELARQHKRFKVSTLSGEPGLISSQKRYIPYASDKKSFGNKTGRSGFEAFVYTFCDPNDTSKVYEVMWDFYNGLTRITPFFKACAYTKTAPAKAINNNPGLKDLSFSITGGSLKAQGYWMPYSCARAICLTFCYDIRHALTPIFGPSFVLECLPTNHPGFARFKIDTEVIRCAQMEAEGWADSPRFGTGEQRVIPRSVPPHETVVSSKELRPRLARPQFKDACPFESDSGDDARSLSSAVDSVEVSPKTTYSGPTWTAINQRHDRLVETKRSPNTPFSDSPLTEPHHTAWRPASAYTSASRYTEPCPPKHANTGQETYHKRRRSSAQKISQDDAGADKRQRRQTRRSIKPIESDSEHVDQYPANDTEVSESESDDVDIIVSTSRKNGFQKGKSIIPARLISSTECSADEECRSKKYSPADFRAARWLLNLHTRDSKLSS